MLRFFSYSFTASDGSEESTAGRVVSPCSIMMHHGLRSKEARRARKQKYRLRQTTSHSSLLVAREGDVSRKHNHAIFLVDSFTYVDEERSDIYIYIYTCIISRRSIAPQHIKYYSKSLFVVQSPYFGSKLPSSGTYK